MKKKDQVDSNMNSEDDRKLVAEYAMAFDLLSKMSHAISEKKAIEGILELFNLLFSPQELFYVSLNEGQPDQIHSLSMVIDDERKIKNGLIGLNKKFAWTDSEKGFQVQVNSKNDILGILVVDAVSFPEYLEHYYNLTTSIIDVCGLVIENAKRYQQIKNAEKQARKEKEKLDAALKQLQTTQSQMLQTEKMASVGQLAAGVAHEMNNPIGFVGSNLDTLSNYMIDVDALLLKYQTFIKAIKNNNSSDLPDEICRQIQTITAYEEDVGIDFIREDIPELIHDCKDGTERVGKIVKDLKGFAHPGNDRKKSIDINQGLESTLNMVRNKFKHKITVIKDFGEIPMVNGFSQELNQVFLSVLMNAEQAIEEKGEIRVQTKEENGNVLVLISDNGCGIKKENISKIFNPFFTTKEVGKGIGLGMNMAYNIIKMHKGDIDVKSNEGKGTVFKITLPGK